MERTDRTTRRVSLVSREICGGWYWHGTRSQDRHGVRVVGDAGEYRHVVSALRQVVGDVVVGEIGANPASIRSVRAAIASD